MGSGAGSAVGSSVGFDVGSAVGSGVGSGVGSSVGEGVNSVAGSSTAEVISGSGVTLGSTGSGVAAGAGAAVASVWPSSSRQSPTRVCEDDVSPMTSSDTPGCASASSASPPVSAPERLTEDAPPMFMSISASPP